VRKSPAQNVAFLGHDTAGHGDRAIGCLPVLQLVPLGVDASLRSLADDACVEDGNVGAFEGVLDVTGGEKPSGEAFRVRHVHLTPDGQDVERPPVRQRLSTSSRIPVLSSPSMEMSMNAGMQTRSRPPGAT